MKYTNYDLTLVFSNGNQPSPDELKSIGEMIKNLPQDKACPLELHKFAEAFDGFDIIEGDICAGIYEDISYQNEIEDFPKFLEYIKTKNPKIDFLVNAFFHTDDVEDDSSPATNTWIVYLCMEDKVKNIHSLKVEYDDDRDEYDRKSEIAHNIVQDISRQYKNDEVIDDYLIDIDDFYDEEDYGFAFNPSRDLNSITIENYYVLESFCAIGFYDKSAEMLYSIGRFNSMGNNPNSYDFIVHEKTSVEDMELVLYHLAEWEYIKSEREIDVQECFEFSNKQALKEKLEETGITICDQLLEKLSQFDSDFPQDV